MAMADRHEGVSVMIREEQPPPIDIWNNRFPYSIVWGPLPPCTCCCPVVGHMGIGDSQGRIHDFAGPYCIGVDDFMVSCVWRYAVVSGPEDTNWDAAIEQADRKYRGRVHDIVCDNCHHHTAVALAHAGQPQKGCGGLLGAWFICCLYGRCTWWHCLYCSEPKPVRRRLGLS